jgi:hypothetical protein
LPEPFPKHALFGVERLLFRQALDYHEKITGSMGRPGGETEKRPASNDFTRSLQKAEFATETIDLSFAELTD